MKRFVVQVVVYAFFWLSCNCAAPQHPEDMPANPRARRERGQSIALTVVCLAPDGTHRVGGSGVAISPRHALTARHVIACHGGTAFEITAEDSKGRRWEMTVDKLADNDADAARLVAVGLAEPFDNWAEIGEMPAMDTQVCVAPAVPARMRGCGTVTRVIKGEFEFWYPGDYGNSGSGVYDYEGRLVGLAVKISPCSNGQFCRTISEGVANWKNLSVGLPTMAWFRTTLELSR